MVESRVSAPESGDTGVRVSDEMYSSHESVFQGCRGTWFSNCQDVRDVV